LFTLEMPRVAARFCCLILPPAFVACVYPGKSTAGSERVRMVAWWINHSTRLVARVEYLAAPRRNDATSSVPNLVKCFSRKGKARCWLF